MSRIQKQFIYIYFGNLNQNFNKKFMKILNLFRKADKMHEERRILKTLISKRDNLNIEIQFIEEEINNIKKKLEQWEKKS